MGIIEETILKGKKLTIEMNKNNEKELGTIPRTNNNNNNNKNIYVIYFINVRDRQREFVATDIKS